MPRLEISGLDEIIADIKRLGVEAERIADDILIVAAEEVSAAWEKATREAGHIDTGDMIKSIGYAKNQRQSTGSRQLRSIRAARIPRAYATRKKRLCCIMEPAV